MTQDPIEVECPKCGALGSEPCEVLDGRELLCWERVKLAMDLKSSEKYEWVKETDEIWLLERIDGLSGDGWFIETLTQEDGDLIYVNLCHGVIESDLESAKKKLLETIGIDPNWVAEVAEVEG
jgi:hypothetical protein